MTTTLITTWSEYDRAVEATVQRARHTLLIFDRNLESLRLERPQRVAALRSLLQAKPRARLAFIVQNADFVRRHSPLLLGLLTYYAPALTVTQTPGHLATLRESLLLADDEHMLVRFDHDQPRARLIVGEPALCMPYRQRFEEIRAEGGDPVSSLTLGL